VTIDFGGQLSKRDFYAMQRLGMGKMRFFGLYLLICIVMVVATGGLNSIRWSADLVKLVPMAIILGLFFAGVPLSIERNWKKNPRVREPVSGRVTEDGISWQSVYQQGQFPWKAIAKWRAGKELVLAYTSPQQAMFFPRHFFQSDSDWNAFLETVKQNVRRG
jgi:YcxB-like protein